MTERLVATGEFLNRAQKRYDDTVIILSQILDRGIDSEQGRAALRRMNQMHGHYPIANEDFLYTLSTFVFEPIRWNQRFGWRPLSETERLASYYYWRDVGRRMNIRDIPETYEAFEDYNQAYERAEFKYGKSNRLIGDATHGVFESWFPTPLRPLVAPGINALLDEPVLAAMDYPRPTVVQRRLAEGALKARARALRFFPRRRRPRLISEERSRSYPSGYRVEDLGVRFTS
jgi:uncharacterized protein (DUF2236 family)